MELNLISILDGVRPCEGSANGSSLNWLSSFARVMQIDDTGELRDGEKSSAYSILTPRDTRQTRRQREKREKLLARLIWLGGAAVAVQTWLDMESLLSFLCPFCFLVQCICQPQPSKSKRHINCSTRIWQKIVNFETGRSLVFSSNFECLLSLLFVYLAI